MPLILKKMNTLFFTDEVGDPVSRQIAEGMIMKYITNHNQQKTNTAYEWFSISELIYTLATFQHKHEATGCRIYFGVITPEAVAKYPNMQKHLDKLTVILVATKKNAADGFEDDLISKVEGYDFGTLCPPGDGNHCQGDQNRSLFADLYN
jgi:hypothetical protein